MRILSNFPKRLFCLSLIASVMLAGCAADQLHRSGLHAIQNNDVVNGVAQLQQAAQMAPDDVQFRKDWLQIRQNVTERLLAKADEAFLLGHADVAEQSYRTILRIDPEDKRAQQGLHKLERSKIAATEAKRGKAALELGDRREAAALATRALDNDSTQADARALRRELDAAEAADTVAAPSLNAMYRRPINLEFRDASLKMVFDALTRTTGINFIFDRDLRMDQRTTVSLNQTSLEDAIDVILTTNQLDKKILNPSSVLVYSTANGKGKEYQDLVVRAFYLSNAEAKNTATLLKSVLKIKEIFIDEKLNMLVLREPPETIALAEKLVALHDLEQPEVMLEVEVLEVNRSRLTDLGVHLSDQLTVSPLSGTLKLSELTGLNSTQIGVNAPSITVTAKANNQDAELLANPRIRVRDREKAQFMIGDKVPIVTTTNTANGFSSENISYLDVGIKLEAVPEMRLHDEIGLKLSMEVSSLVSSIKTNNGSLAYQLGTRSVNTVLRLKDGETQVMAGLINKDDRSSANGLPFISELPILGRLFATKENNRSKTEIVLAITPRLVRKLERKEASAESFWSGTETSIRATPIRLRKMETPSNPMAAPPMPFLSVQPTVPSSMPGAPIQPMSITQPPSQVPDVKLRWNGAEQGAAGAVTTVELRVDSVERLRALPIELGYDPNLVEIIEVKPGDYFSKKTPANFSAHLNKDAGQISVSTVATDSAGGTAEGQLLTIKFKPLKVSSEARFVVKGATPVGVSKAVQPPVLPPPFKLVVQAQP